ncbi:MFS transporter [Streptomyces sp. NPDC047315]|uniref:MFS transporter n=1 Tax=Streptomyces sp. NPDC047315 TaxID=3155142 RepID=UPI0033E6B4BD
MPVDVSTAVVSGAAPGHAPPERGRRLGLALFVIAAAQLMVVVDATITNIALPSIQNDLGMTDANLAWVVNAYALAFGGLLLLGGRAGDLFGRRRVFQVGIAVFTLASLLGGLAPNEELLLGARVLQGVGAAMAAPSALALIATTFPQGRARNRAMGVYAAMGGVGATIGLLLGGVLTDAVDWRWVFFVNIPVGLLILVGTRTLTEAERGTGRLDVPGAITGTGGLVALVYGITRGGEHGWSDDLTLLACTVGAALLVAFLLVQSRSAHPMMPLRLLRDRRRSGSYATMLFVGGGMFAMFYFLTLYLQLVLGYGPVKAGLATLPFSVGMAVAAGVSSRLTARLAPRAIAGPGLLLAAVGMLWFTRLDTDSSYTVDVLPAAFVIAIGLGLCFVPMTLGAISGVGDEDSGIASALLNTVQQVGGALGLAIMSTLSTAAADDRLPGAATALHQGLAARDHDLVTKAGEALAHGYTRAFVAAAVMFLAALAVVVTAVNSKKPQHTDTAADPAPPVHLG